MCLCPVTHRGMSDCPFHDSRGCVSVHSLTHGGCVSVHSMTHGDVCLSMP